MIKVIVRFADGHRVRFPKASKISYDGNLIIVLDSDDKVLGIFSEHNVTGVYQE